MAFISSAHPFPVRLPIRRSNINLYACAPFPPGHVRLVSTGPGDPSYLTQASLSLISQADIIFHDRLTPPLPTKTTLISVGKSEKSGATQLEINRMLVHHARLGQRVLRLKGGDAAIFGRMGSELAYLRKHHVPVEVVPGVTTASAVAARLGFSLTMKGVNALLFITAHQGSHQQWMTPDLLDCVTVVIYMGLKRLPDIINLWNEGVPVVAVQALAMPEERVVFGFTHTIVEQVQNAGLRSPTIFVVGEVVRMATDWPYTTSSTLQHDG